MTVEIYSDVACPWCYVGERRLSRALAAFPQGDRVEIVYRPFQLDPAASETPVPLPEVLRAKFGSQLDAVLRQTAATAAEDGLSLQFESAQAVNTLAAHRLLALALAEGGPDVQRTLAEALFEAYFTRGLNVADPTVLADLAEAAGLDRTRVAALLASDEGTAEVQEAIAHAQRLGVRAVPTFVFDGRTALQGAQPASVFLQVLEQAHRDAAPSSASDASCADGACAA